MIRIINPGLFTTVQDSGRIGFQSLGIPVSGAMDKNALLIGNILNGNKKHSAALEITYSGFKCEFLTDMTIALTGGNLEYEINNVKVLMNETLFINQGDKLEAKGVIKGIRGYLTVLGGIDVKSILGSQSTYIKGGFGGFEGRKLTAGDILKTNKCNLKPLKTKRVAKQELLRDLYDKRKLRVILGPEDHRFSDKGINTFFNEAFTINNDSDRMGYRLSGRSIDHLEGADILSSGLTFGSIQIPGNGQPIIMMSDRQTTGGYTKIAHVISCDHSYLAQLQANDTIYFENIEIEDAQNIYEKFNKKIENWELKLSNEKLKEETFKRFNIQVNKKIYNIKVAERDDQ